MPGQLSSNFRRFPVDLFLDLNKLRRQYNTMRKGKIKYESECTQNLNLSHLAKISSVPYGLVKCIAIRICPKATKSYYQTNEGRIIRIKKVKIKGSYGRNLDAYFS